MYGSWTTCGREYLQFSSIKESPNPVKLCGECGEQTFTARDPTLLIKWVFFSIFWGRTQALFAEPLIPLFWTSGDVSPEFQRQGGFLLHAFSLVCIKWVFIKLNLELILTVFSIQDFDTIVSSKISPEMESPKIYKESLTSMEIDTFDRLKIGLNSFHGELLLIRSLLKR